MWEMESAPIDSYDLYARGLRPGRCNGCKFEKLAWELGDEAIVLVEADTGSTSIYELGAEPWPGQMITEWDGLPIRSRGSYMSVGHSDECWNWRPPNSKDENTLNRNWRDNLAHCVLHALQEEFDIKPNWFDSWLLNLLLPIIGVRGLGIYIGLIPIYARLFCLLHARWGWITIYESPEYFSSGDIPWRYAFLTRLFMEKFPAWTDHFKLPRMEWMAKCLLTGVCVDRGSQHVYVGEESAQTLILIERGLD